MENYKQKPMSMKFLKILKEVNQKKNKKQNILISLKPWQNKFLK